MARGAALRLVFALAIAQCAALQLKEDPETAAWSPEPEAEETALAATASTDTAPKAEETALAATDSNDTALAAAENPVDTAIANNTAADVAATDAPATQKGFEWDPTWTYFPSEPRVGIVTGGTPFLYEDANFASKTAALMLKYAKRKGYALYVDKNMGRLSERQDTWNKVILMHKLLKEVPILVWMDPDMVLTSFEKSIEVLLSESSCDGAHQTRWEKYLPKESGESTFLWLSGDMKPGGWDQYLVNANTGIVVLRRTPRAFEFLEKVWHVGDAPEYDLRHGYMGKKGKMHRTDEWPWEQGAFWEVLAAEPAKFMTGSCFAPVGTLQSVFGNQWAQGQFAQHCAEMSDAARKKVATVMLRKMGGAAEII